MRSGATYNVIVAGLGGQGVNTLTRVLFELSSKYRLPCQGALFKGGAQKAGTIHSELKIFIAAADDHARYSNQILEGTLDLMLGLEPFEAARFTRYFRPDTRLIINAAAVPFYSERRSGLRPAEPLEELSRRYAHVTVKNFSEMASQTFGDRRMANRLMLLEAAAADGFPFAAGAVQDVFDSRLQLEPSVPTPAEGK